MLLCDGLKGSFTPSAGKAKPGAQVHSGYLDHPKEKALGTAACGNGACLPGPKLELRILRESIHVLPKLNPFKHLVLHLRVWRCCHSPRAGCCAVDVGAVSCSVPPWSKAWICCSTVVGWREEGILLPQTSRCWRWRLQALLLAAVMEVMLTQKWFEVCGQEQKSVSCFAPVRPHHCKGWDRRWALGTARMRVTRAGWCEPPCALWAILCTAAPGSASWEQQVRLPSKMGHVLDAFPAWIYESNIKYPNLTLMVICAVWYAQ